MSYIPFLVLIALITCCVAAFGNATLDGASQVSILVASAVSVLIGHFAKRLTYKQHGYEARLLSRSCEDGATVTSVLVPWNTCGLTQSTVLGVATLTYLPYCFFNILSPLTSIVVVAIGWKIVRRKS